jgi:hypothetical protein
MKLALTPVVALLLLACPALAYAQPEPDEGGSLPAEPTASAPAPASPVAAAPSSAAESPALRPKATPRYDYFRFGAGFRIGYIDDPGFDAFAKNDVLAQMSLEGTYAFYTKGKLAIASGLAWDIGIEDPSSPETLSDAPWVFAADLSGGASVRLAGGNDHEVRRARLWLTTEVGYGFTQSHSLRPAPNRNEEDVLGSDAETRLGSLALNGAFWRAGLAVSF